MARDRRTVGKKGKSKSKSKSKITLGGLRALNTLSGVWGQPPAGLRESSFTPNRMGLPTTTYSQDRPTIAESQADIDRATVEQAGGPQTISRDPSYGVTQADKSRAINNALAAQRAISVDAPNKATPNASLDQRMGPTSGLPGLSDYDRSVLAQASARFNPAAVRATISPTDIANKTSVVGQKSARLGAAPEQTGLRSIAAPAELPDKETARLAPDRIGGPPREVAAQQPDRLTGVSNPGTGLRTVSRTAPMEVSIPGPNPSAMDRPGVNVSPEQRAINDQVDTSFDDRYDQAVSKPSVGPMTAREAENKSMADYQSQLAQAVAATNEDPNATYQPDQDTLGPVDNNLAPAKNVRDYNVATVDDAAGTFPDAPPEPTIGDTNMGIAKKTVGGLLGGGIPGAAMGLVSGLMSRQPGFDAVVPSAERFSTGTGLGGIMGAMGGAKGAQGFSQSNPGMSYTSLGNGQGLRRSEKYGWSEVVGPDGSVRGIRYDEPEKKGILGKVSSYFDGKFGGYKGGSSMSRMSGISPGAAKSIGAGKGGLY